MDVKSRLQQLMDERGWSIYRLAKEAGIPWSTVRNMFKRDTDPSLFTLEAICKGLGMTPVQFFDADNEQGISGDERKLLTGWSRLSPRERELVLELIRALDKRSGPDSIRETNE